MKKLILSFICIVIIGALAFFALKGRHNGPKFKTDLITKGDITETITASGTVDPVTSISVGAQDSGTIKKLYVDFNSHVKKGQLLALIDPSLFEAQVIQAQANLNNTKANLNNTRANLSKIQATLINDEKTYRENKNLYDKNFVAKTALDLAQANYDSDKAQIAGAKAQIAGAKAQIAQAAATLSSNETSLKYTRIVSPVNGIVVSRNIDVGQTVAASFQTPTLFQIAQDLTKMQIDTNVAEADIGKVKVGQKVDYNVDSYPDTIFKGKVKQIRIASTMVQNVVTYDVVVDVNNKALKLIPGMTANVSIVTAKKHNIFRVPNAALRFIPRDDNEPNTNLKKYKEQGVWIIGKKGQPKRISVKTGVSDGNYTEIISKKLTVGQKVITGMLEKRQKGGQSGGPRMF